MDVVRTQEIFDAGYAIALYNIATDRRIWRYRDEEIELPSNAVLLHSLDGVSYSVAKIEDVRAANK